jgi:hypothetical protein
MIGIRRLSLPAIFWRDHYDRCSDHEGVRVIVQDNGRRVIVELDDAALADLKSDAEYYSDGVDFCGEKAAYRSLIVIASSSRAFAVRCVSVTRCRSVFHFSTVTVPAIVFFPSR